MAFRRIALSLLVVAALAAGCARDEGSGISPQEPIGAPQAGANYDSGTEEAAESSSPAVIKDAQIEMQVMRPDITEAAQRIVDVAGSSKVGGFLVSSFIDLDDGYGHADISVKVPTDRFEAAVVELGTIGDVRRQWLQGQDRSGQYAQARNKIYLAERRVSSLLSALDDVDDPGTRFDLRQKLAEARSDLARSQGSKSVIEAQTTYSTIKVSLLGTPPPPPPEKPVLDRALATAKTIMLAVLSGIILAAGALLPIAALLLIVYVIALQVRKRLRVRLES